ncbi:hypothetical protein CP960_05710 [Malaciobacter halophilus]|uniref:Uncharacterized protein n=1 Tax=Malaciobacter halophilus TaxID=197482 RepID=A0A2N1J3B8_9BACT|nr:hypothetical protein [Malaciobacter halophilus]AXH09151.1 hypothetical protein AHALO_0766 [Malaciobacter halophilus]PKI81053.1 hypothetical protein CP960_05710 [Malaciobacter halophilus]
MKIVFLLFSLSFILNGAIIVGNQKKVASLSSDITVTSSNITRNLSVAQVVEIKQDGKLSEVRILKRGELKDILKLTSTTDLSKKINIKVGVFNKNDALDTYKGLLNYFNKEEIFITKYEQNYLIRLEDINYAYAKKIFPEIKKYLRK